MASSAPLPRLPENPVGDLPDNPLGAPPQPPIVGKRQPLRFPSLGERGQRGRSTRAPLPNLDVLNQRRRAVQQAKKQQKAQTPTPAAPAGRRAAPAQPTAPIVLQPQRAPVAGQVERQPGQRRRTPTEVRESLLDHIEAVHGPQVAHHPALQHADIRDNLIKAHSARWRGDLASVHAAGLAESERIKRGAQRDNPGYTPPEDRQPPAEGAGVMTPELRAKRAEQYRAMRRALNGEAE